MLSESELQRAIEMLAYQREVLFTEKADRDQVYAALPQLTKRLVARTSISNQLLDPRYTFEGRDLPDKGLGNDKRMYGRLYIIQTRNV